MDGCEALANTVTSFDFTSPHLQLIPTHLLFVIRLYMYTFVHSPTGCFFLSHKRLERKKEKAERYYNEASLHCRGLFLVRVIPLAFLPSTSPNLHPILPVSPKANAIRILILSVSRDTSILSARGESHWHFEDRNLLKELIWRIR
ncbi:hypothetical protein SCHPADRAFT_490533 [Schizopora paradoxa]|uniref:Uncharacterized protein n=1 Tax=Schizopora paradoxa TaxID=27342 RepID=A0A0H2RNM6_9AGAM|nr:hypothetical protein SCHPADRAFT_490533 [Schizopora paradoxa]